MATKALVTGAIALLLIVPLLSVPQATNDSACSDGDGSLMSLGVFSVYEACIFMIFMAMFRGHDFEASLFGFAGLGMCTYNV